MAYFIRQPVRREQLVVRTGLTAGGSQIRTSSPACTRLLTLTVNSRSTATRHPNQTGSVMQEAVSDTRCQIACGHPKRG
jgi:hypothetical protein